MMEKDKPGQVGSNSNESNSKEGNELGEKSRIGGKFNSGVTSEDKVEKEQIEKKASLNKIQPLSENEKKNQQSSPDDSEV
jgi:hypothetical protein